MLVDYEAVKLVNEEVELILTLDLIVLLSEYLSLNLRFSDLLNSWEE